MRTKALIALGVACTCAASAFAQQSCITIPDGEFRLVPWPFTVSTPPIIIGPLPTLHMLVWNGEAYDESLVSPPMWDFPPVLRGTAVVLHPVGGPVTICFPEPTQAPNLPLPLGIGYSAVCCQSNVVSGFEGIVGRPPWEGVQVYKLNPGPGRDPTHFASPDFAVFTFSGGSWTPTVPVAEILEGIFVYQPPPKLWNLQVVNGQVRFDVTAPPGRTVIVEYADEFTSTGVPVTWKQLTTLTGNGDFQPLTAQAGDTIQRFYRARL